MLVQFDFNNVFVMLLLGIIVLLYLRSEKCCERERFSMLDKNMNLNESQRVLNCSKFSLECCPSMYSNDKGCMCINEEQEEILRTRGYNKTEEGGY
uniref:Uncharacterized protein n=1 Tax=Pyramimonas orientalis virus TaxID=455367 RepID=A0A7M3UNW2_POV01|nr:hypothetical protein HWQ62_00266 [Pyramimonas orientalis virus]